VPSRNGNTHGREVNLTRVRIVELLVSFRLVRHADDLAKARIRNHNRGSVAPHSVTTR